MMAITTRSSIRVKAPAVESGRGGAPDAGSEFFIMCVNYGNRCRITIRHLNITKEVVSSTSGLHLGIKSAVIKNKDTEG
jgi:hypothetical protein